MISRSLLLLQMATVRQSESDNILIEWGNVGPRGPVVTHYISISLLRVGVRVRFGRCVSLSCVVKFPVTILYGVVFCNFDEDLQTGNYVKQTNLIVCSNKYQIPNKCEWYYTGWRRNDKYQSRNFVHDISLYYCPSIRKITI